MADDLVTKMRAAGLKSALKKRYEATGRGEGPRLREAPMACANPMPEGSGPRCGCGVSSRAHRRRQGVGVDRYRAKSS